MMVHLRLCLVCCGLLGGVLSVGCNPCDKQGRDPEPTTTPEPTATQTASERAAARKPDTDPTVRYTVRPTSDLKRLAAEVCFSGAVPPRLASPQGSAASLLARAEHGDRTLEPNDGHVALDGVEPGECITLTVDVGRVLRDARKGAKRLGGDAILSPDWWLWKPEPHDGLRVRARFEMPDGLQVAVPWERIDDEYPLIIDDSCFAWRAQAAFGSLEERGLEAPGTELDLRLLGAGFGPREKAVVEWVRTSAKAASVLFGRFPTDEALVLLVSDEDRDSDFGYVVRGGGPAITLLLPSRPDDDMLDWMATHEMLHLVLPPVDLDDAWLTEGLITYLTAVARARAGMIDEREAWWELLDGFDRGAEAGTGKTTREESASMHETHAYWRVYWAGAAMALEWDVRLREQGSSLPKIVAALMKSQPSRDRRWQGEAIVEQLDRLCDCDVFSEVTAKHLDEVAFPETGALERALGVTIAAKERAAFDDDAPKASIRRAIMAR